MAARTPEEVDRLFGEHLNAGNLEALLALYEPDASLLDEAGTPATGTAAPSRSCGASPTAAGAS